MESLEEIKRIALKLKELEACGDLRVVYSNAIGPNAMVMENTGKFVILLNPSLSYEQQIIETWHEAKHIYSHLNNSNINVAYAEYETEQFINKIISKPELFQELKMVNNF